MLSGKQAVTNPKKVVGFSAIFRSEEFILRDRGAWLKRLMAIAENEKNGGGIVCACPLT
jgi:hypothetical protein